MEEHLRAEESLVAHVNVDHVAIDGLVDKRLELGRLDHLLSFLVELRVVLAEFFEHVLAHVTVLFFDSCSDFQGVFGLKLFTSVFQCLEHVLCYIATGKRNAFDTAADDSTIANREDVSDTVTRINDSACHFIEVNLIY